MKFPEQAVIAAETLCRHLNGDIVGLYLHGSAAVRGLRTGSDIDILAVVEHSISSAIRRDLIRDLSNISGRHPRSDGAPRPLEVLAFRRDDLNPPPYPARCEFVFGEWLRAGIDAGHVPPPEVNSEFTLVLAQARSEAKPMAGPELSELIPAIAWPDVKRAIADTLPELLRSINGDEVNVVLTLARMWVTLVTGRFVSKDAAADWAADRMAHDPAATLAAARDIYLGREARASRLSADATREAARKLERQLNACLGR